MRTNPIKKKVKTKKNAAAWAKARLIFALTTAFICVYFFFFKILFF
jgi:hypothetical protein